MGLMTLWSRPARESRSNHWGSPRAIRFFNVAAGYWAILVSASAQQLLHGHSVTTIFYEISMRHRVGIEAS
jgi:hypothetical protein